MKAVTIVTGILTAIFGCIAIFMPVRVFLALGWLLAFLLLFRGVEMSINGFSGKKDIWLGILGIIVALGGVGLIFNGIYRGFTDVLLACFAGASIVVSGGYIIAAGCKGFKASKGKAILQIVVGILEVLVGLFAMAHPLLTMASLGIVLAVNVLMQGISLTAVGFAMEK